MGLRKVIVIVMAVALIAVCAVLVSGSDYRTGSLTPTTQGRGDTEFVLNTDYPQTNGEYVVFKTVPISVTNKYVEEIGRLFDLTGIPELINPLAGEIELVDNTKTLSERLIVYKSSGAFIYDIPDKAYPTAVETQPVLPSKVEAERIATEYLSSKGLLPEDAKVERIFVNQQQEVWKQGLVKPVKVFDITLAVRYNRNINGIPIYGDEFVVFIGDNGEVVGILKSWRDITQYDSAKMKTPAQAYDELRGGKTVLPEYQDVYDRVVINDISLGYWMEPRDVQQSYVLPVYVFTGTAIQNGKEGAYTQYVHAVLPEELDRFS